MPPLYQISATWDHVLAYSPGYTNPNYPYDTHGLLAWGHDVMNHNATIPNLWDDPETGYWRIDPTAKVKSISAGEFINVVLFDNGQVACWGDSSWGVDPRPLDPPNPLRPAQFQPFHPNHALRFKEAIAGGHFVALLTTTGEIITYGALVYPNGGVYGPGYRGDSATYPINNVGSPEWLPLVYLPPYRGLAATHHTVMALRDSPRPAGQVPDEEALLDMWGGNAGDVRELQPSPGKIHWTHVAGGSYTPWVVGKNINTGELIGWGGVISNFFPNPAPFGAFEIMAGNSNGHILALCYNPNCDGSTTAPVLTANDFTCFTNAYAAAQSLSDEEKIKSYANCDGSTALPVLTGNDFVCFTNKYAAGGCP